MKAAFYSFSDKKFFIKEIPEPKPEAGEILVKIKKSALCGTDLHIMSGDLADKAYSRKEIVLGHEWSGIVAGTGKGAKKFEKGDKIVGFPHIPCGRCKNCQKGDGNLCDKQAIFGLSRAGSHAEFLVVPENAVFRLPEGIGFSEGSLLGDTISTAFHSIKKASLQRGQRALILGAGPVGLAIGILLRAKGVKTWVFEKNDFRFSLAKKLFLARRVDKNNFKKFRRTFEFSFETSGSVQLFDYAFHSLARGGKLLLIATHGQKFPLDALRLMYRELSILGCFGYSCGEVDEFLKFVSVAPVKKNINRLITEEFDLIGINRAYKKFRSGNCGKVILKINP